MLGYEKREVNMVRLNTPLKIEEVLSLQLGEMVFLNGILFTAWDMVHRYLARQTNMLHDLPFDTQGGIIYHCSPILKKTDQGYFVISAGPTTSSSVELYQPKVIESLGIKAIIGKGGMGLPTIKIMQEYGCVYLSAIGGSSVYLAERIKKVIGSWMIDEFGESEAMWALEVEDFPVIVTIDAHQNSLHSNIHNLSSSNIKDLISN